MKLNKKKHTDPRVEVWKKVLENNKADLKKTEQSYLEAKEFCEQQIRLAELRISELE